MLPDDPTEVTTPRRQVARRLRFEILRRDGHTCRYCGAMAPDVKLTVDHVVPVVLGGSDEPTNLVTACKDCNSGKASTGPDSPIVADVARDALRWKRAIESAVATRLAEREVVHDVVARFEAKWKSWGWDRETWVTDPAPEPTGDVLVDNWNEVGYTAAAHSRPIGFDDGTLRVLVEKGWVTDVRRALSLVDTRRSLGRALGMAIETVDVTVADIDWPGPLPSRRRSSHRHVERVTEPLPSGWQDSIERFYSIGLPEQEMHHLVDVTMQRKPNEPFTFFCGCCWRAITDLQEDARRVIESEDK